MSLVKSFLFTQLKAIIFPMLKLRLFVFRIPLLSKVFIINLFNKKVFHQTKAEFNISLKTLKLLFNHRFVKIRIFFPLVLSICIF